MITQWIKRMLWGEGHRPEQAEVTIQKMDDNVPFGPGAILYIDDWQQENRGESLG
ncbi:hypothetical protein [Paenibacillus pabuli]|uniref:hypothetical protein n=1 Tax=Paenibacillus pabuli TaxID=1472 RepID=UPI001FFFE76C|nr:hypothetical protein [Paenibacillus pabuli]UPK45879.1 hypothetical protein KET34_10680 [Paenibacillus pabuli]